MTTFYESVNLEPQNFNFLIIKLSLLFPAMRLSGIILLKEISPLTKDEEGVMHSKKEVLTEALNLPPIERAELIEELISSFDFPDRKRLDVLWADEVEDRIDAYDRGDLSAAPLAAVFEKINKWPR
jgi:putative addiction module component (TIGR02574 family)